MSRFILTEDMRGNLATLTPGAPMKNDNLVLTASVAKYYDIPDGYRVFGISCTQNLFIRFDGAGAAVVPSGDILDGTGVAVNFGNFCIPAGVKRISLISPADCIVGISRWEL